MRFQLQSEPSFLAFMMEAFAICAPILAASFAAFILADWLMNR